MFQSANRWNGSVPRSRFLAPRRRDSERSSRRQFLPRVDLMEDRTLLSMVTVMNNHDSGPGSLRAAITTAASGETIDFANSLKGETISPSTGWGPAISPSAAAGPAACFRWMAA
jgi:hypothetical protein